MTAGLAASMGSGIAGRTPSCIDSLDRKTAKGKGTRPVCGREARSRKLTDVFLVSGFKWFVSRGIGSRVQPVVRSNARARIPTNCWCSLEATPFAREEGSGQTRMVQVLHAVRTKRIKLLETLYVIASRSQKRDN